MFKQTIILVILTTLNTQYSLSLGFPFLLDKFYAKITTVKWDGLNGFHVAFQNKEYRHYSSDFSNYTSYNLSYVVQLMNTMRFSFNNVPLSNGTLWTMKSSMNIIFTNHMRSMKICNQTNMDELQSYTFSQTIMAYYCLPLDFFSTFIPHHILITNETVKIIYLGVVNIAFNFSQLNTTGLTCTSALYTRGYILRPTDAFQHGYYFTAALSNKDVLNIFVKVRFQLNHTSSKFDLTYSVNHSLLFTTSNTVDKMFLTNKLILMQSNATGTLYLYNTANNSEGTISNLIPKNEIIALFLKFGNIYLLQSNGLIQVSFNAPSNTLSLVNLTSPLPFNMYGITLGSQFDVFYIRNAPYIYKAGLCMNQSIYDGVSSCKNYNCSISDCVSCSLTSAVCSICNTGFVRDNFYQCSHSNTTLNSAQSINSSQLSFMNSQWILDILAFLIEIMKTIISVPGARKLVTPLFYYFSNFDDLYLYSLHSREYSYMINQLFQQIANIQNKKWSLLSFQQVCEYIGLNSSKILSFLQFQKDYMLVKTAKGTNSQGLFTNCLNFLLIEAFLLFVAFIIFRIIFKAMRKFIVSQIIRKFDFWLYFLILIFEGNVQQFTFYLTTELRVVFAFQWANKIIKVFVFFFAHSLIIFSISGYFISLIFYTKLNRYFTENNKNSFHGSLLMILQNGVRNLLLGVIHSTLRSTDYQYLIGPLITIEVVFFIIFLIGISYRVYIENTKIWIYQIFTLIRVQLIVTFSLDKTCLDQITFNHVHKILIFIMVSLSIISILFILFEFLIILRRFLMRSFLLLKKTAFNLNQQVVIDQLPRLKFSIRRFSENKKTVVIKQSKKN